MERQKKRQKGITLIALVISIIVMLILAGVSLNMTIGENGIITQAQNATYAQSAAIIEEWLNEKYVEYYDENDNYSSKLELLSSKISNLFLKDGMKNYITNSGKIYYLLNKSSLPEDIKSGVKGGDTVEYVEYIRLLDVYGVTEDLKVYYCESGTGNIVGTYTEIEVDPDTLLASTNKNEGLKNSIIDALGEIGIVVDEEEGIKLGDISGLKELTIDGSKYNISSLEGISELKTLKNVNFKNLNIQNLNGIESLSLLESLYFEDCIIDDYTKLSTAIGLNKLYFKLSESIDKDSGNQQIVNISKGLQDAIGISNLQYFGIFGDEKILSRTQNDNTTNIGKYEYRGGSTGNFDNISSLSLFSNNIKSSINYLYLNNSKITSISSLEGFFGLQEVAVCGCRQLTSLSGLENKNIIYLIAQQSGIESLLGISGCNKLVDLSIYSSNLRTFEGLSSKDLRKIYASNCKIENVDALENSNLITYLDLSKNTDKKNYSYKLQNITALKACSKITTLWLEGNDRLAEEVLSSVEFKNIIKQCGTNYSLDTTYSLLFLDMAKVDLSNNGLTDEQLELLRNNTSIQSIKLTGNKNLSNPKIESILASMPNLTNINLYGLTNVTSINFMNTLKKVVELDLRQTSVTNLSVLETLANSNKLTLGTLLIDNSEINISEIQKTISSVSNKLNNTEISFNRYDNLLTRGMVIASKTLCEKITATSCRNITSFRNYNAAIPSATAGGAIIDLSGCVGLTDIYTRCFDATFKIPSSCMSLKLDSTSRTPDLSNASGLTQVNIGWASGDNFSHNEFFKGLKNCVNLSSVTFSSLRPNNSVLENVQNLRYTKLITFDISRSETISKILIKETYQGEPLDIPNIKNFKCTDVTTFNSLESLNYFTELQTIDVTNTSVSDLSPISGNTTLISLIANNTNVNSLVPLKNLSLLKTVKIKNAKISDLNGIQNLNSLTTLDVNNNSISNLYYLEKLIDSGAISLTSVDLSNNSLQDTIPVTIKEEKIKEDGTKYTETTKIASFDNVAVIKKLQSKGCKIILSGNLFNESTIAELRALNNITI